MKVRIDFEEMKKAVGLVNKIAKQNGSLEDALIKIKAKRPDLELSTNGKSAGIVVKVPAQVTEDGEFVAKMSSINMLTIRSCSGNIDVVREEDSPNEPLRLTYRNGLANMKLPATADAFNDVKQASESGVAVPVKNLAAMYKDVGFAVDKDSSNKYHAIQMDIEDDEDEILKISMMSFNQKSTAFRTSFAVKEGQLWSNGKCSCVMCPEHLSAALDVLQCEDAENAFLYVDENHAYMKNTNVSLCIRLIDHKLPEIDKFIANRESNNFTISVDKAEMLEALKCILYVSQEHKLESFNTSVEMGIMTDSLSIKNVGLSQYTEKIEAETSGLLPSLLYFDAGMLKSAVEAYPSERVVFSGNKSKPFFWMTCGDNAEYVYCVGPRSKPKK